MRTPYIDACQQQATTVRHVGWWQQLGFAVFFVLLPVAHSAAQDAAPTHAATPDVHEKKVCKSEVVTGSRMKKRICMTSERWAAREKAAKDMTREMDGKPQGKEASEGVSGT